MIAPSRTNPAQGDDRGIHPAATGQTATGPEFQGLHMLVVDDEADTLAMLKTVLESAHAEVRACGSATEALKIVQEWKTDALISDLDMPGQDGYELIGKIREHYGNRVVAIALTAHVQLKDRARALKDGFDAFVAKPVMPDELLAAVSDSLQKDSLKTAHLQGGD
jgi:CheY-like chemotaxis protein